MMAIIIFVMARKATVFKGITLEDRGPVDTAGLNLKTKNGWEG